MSRGQKGGLHAGRAGKTPICLHTIFTGRLALPISGVTMKADGRKHKTFKRRLTSLWKTLHQAVT
jgi:hypothetical protein